MYTKNDLERHYQHTVMKGSNGFLLSAVRVVAAARADRVQQTLKLNQRFQKQKPPAHFRR